MDDSKPRILNIGQAEELEESDDFEDPFATFSWQQWLEMQTQALQRFARFQRAIARRQPKLAALIALEMQEMVLAWQREATEWVNMDVK